MMNSRPARHRQTSQRSRWSRCCAPGSMRLTLPVNCDCRPATVSRCWCCAAERAGCAWSAVPCHEEQSRRHARTFCTAWLMCAATELTSSRPLFRLAASGCLYPPGRPHQPRAGARPSCPRCVRCVRVLDELGQQQLVARDALDGHDQQRLQVQRRPAHAAQHVCISAHCRYCATLSAAPARRRGLGHGLRLEVDKLGPPRRLQPARARALGTRSDGDGRAARALTSSARTMPPSGCSRLCARVCGGIQRRVDWGWQQRRTHIRCRT
jgi:hypothetical protein